MDVNNKKQRIVIWLEPIEIDILQKIAHNLTDNRAKEEAEKGVPPSKRGRKVSRSKAARAMVLRGMQEWEKDNLK